MTPTPQRSLDQRGPTELPAEIWAYPFLLLERPAMVHVSAAADDAAQDAIEHRQPRRRAA